MASGLLRSASTTSAERYQVAKEPGREEHHGPDIER
jgi:hypothetical protein